MSGGISSNVHQDRTLPVYSTSGPLRVFPVMLVGRRLAGGPCGETVESELSTSVPGFQCASPNEAASFSPSFCPRPLHPLSISSAGLPALKLEGRNGTFAQSTLGAGCV